MAVTGTKTVRDLTTAALRKAGVAGLGESPSAEMADEARDELERMLKAWQNKGYNLWTKTSGSLTLTTAGSYTLSPVRPLRILTARYNDGSSETQMQCLTREEYDQLPVKTSTGTPTTYYYDRQREAAKLYIWPLLATASGQTIEFTYEREIEDIASLSDTVDVPGEWWDAVVYGLADRILDTVPVRDPTMTMKISARARESLMDALAFDTEESVWFAGYDG